MNNLPENFEDSIRKEIENEVLPNLKSMVLDHFPNLNATYKPTNPEAFLFAYTIGLLEDAYHKVYLIESKKMGSDEEYFAIHRIISDYKNQIKSKITEFLSSQ